MTDTPPTSEKYPRTLHVPWSPGATSDDKFMPSAAHFVGVEIIIAEKLDGENNCMTNEEDGYYARSHGGLPSHPSNKVGKQLQKAARYDIDPHISVFGEYCYAVHSILYNKGLPGYFNVFGVQDNRSKAWWAWDDVCLMADVLGFPTVPVLWRGTVRSVEELHDITVGLCESQASVYGEGLPDGGFLTRPDRVTVGIREGVVCRIACGYSDFSMAIGKWVRPGHVSTNEHWKRKPVERQPLITG